MAVNIDIIYGIIDEIAPFSEAYSWDNSGCLIRVNDETENILVALDLTEDVISQAIEQQCNLIVTHHPVLFQPVKKIDRAVEEHKNIIRLIENNISLISAHTNMDQAQGGINGYLAQKLQLKDIRILAEEYEPLLKIAVFVPSRYMHKVMQAACEAGAGQMGNYAYCTFGAEGMGTFMPNEKANPFCGEQGKLHREPETRLEMICPKNRLNAVMEAIRQYHPYEEPAVDVYTLQQPANAKGTARIGTLEREYEKNAFIQHVKQSLGLEMLKVSAGGKQKIMRVAVCGGGGASLISLAAKNGADAYLTGEIKHSDYVGQGKNAMVLIEAGHYDTEKCFCTLMFEGLQRGLNALKCNVNVLMANISRPYDLA